MDGVLARLQDLVKEEAAQLVAQVAKAAGRDPLTALGIPADLPMLPDVALLLHQLMNPKKPGERTEAELDEEAARIMARQDLHESWERALRSGYTGPWGQLIVTTRTLTQPEPAPLTPLLW